MVYGRNGVEDSWVNSGEELGILVTVSGGGIERNRSHLALLRATLLHWGFDGRKATAGNLAFPFSPSDLQFGDEGVLTICGTRDPSFISRWQEILKEVEDYVQSLSCQEGLTVRFVAAGLQGQHLLQCREVVASTAAAARTQLQADPRAIESWLCHGSVAADYTVHHLLDLDEKLLRDLFPIRVLHSDGSEEDVEATLLPWDAPPTASSAEAYQDWESSAKPSGWRVAGCNLGDLAKVVRSKNAGVNEITYDIMFADEESYNYAKSSPALDASAVPLQNILGIFCDDTCWAIKITCARQVLAGSAGDRDVYGAQQHSRLLSVQLYSLRTEIATLTGESLPEVTDVSSVASLARSRELYLEGDLTTENLAEVVFRTQLLGELLADLQACRLIAKKFCCTDLRLELSDKAEELLNFRQSFSATESVPTTIFKAFGAGPLPFVGASAGPLCPDFSGTAAQLARLTGATAPPAPTPKSSGAAFLAPSPGPTPKTPPAKVSSAPPPLSSLSSGIDIRDPSYRPSFAKAAGGSGDGGASSSAPAASGSAPQLDSSAPGLRRLPGPYHVFR
ncbi:hypothetical protein AK812_SmicGene29811 [Symbiodinium microadriaticum]|uniref:DUF4387 domain-containing protein n=1 Tax=Symbiodinium microadriaticum TaxID=2951 RepID=A0A1Q9D0V8_SYMMI|nr:hypothetical protein AK812_SmicGene29811 [Symbiodinium microadriaticum]